MSFHVVRYNSERRPLMHHPCKSWFKSAQWFQRKGLKCEKQTTRLFGIGDLNVCGYILVKLAFNPRKTRRIL
jgi:hypothetical protein